jgi:hypothetical protein
LRQLKCVLNIFVTASNAAHLYEQSVRRLDRPLNENRSRSSRQAKTSACLLLPMQKIDMPNNGPLAPYERHLSGFVVLGVIWVVLSVIMDLISH